MFLPAAVGRALTIARPLPWPGQMLERRWRTGDVIAATFSQINIVNIITAPRSLAAHPHNSIVNSSRRSFGTIKIAVPSSIIYFAFETNVFVLFNIHNLGGESCRWFRCSGVFSKSCEYQCQNWRRPESIKSL